MLYSVAMTQVSKYPLDKKVETEVFRKFWHSLSSLRDADAVASFFSDFLSGTEKIMLAKRFAIAILLLRGKRPKDIKKVLHVSDSSTSSVGAWLKNARPKTVVALERVIKESHWDDLVDKIEGMLDELPPRYSTNWQRASQEKRLKKLDRAARKSVR